MLKIQFALTHRVKDLDVQVKYDDIDFEFQNLMGGGLMGNTLNLVIQKLYLLSYLCDINFDTFKGYCNGS